MRAVFLAFVLAVPALALPPAAPPPPVALLGLAHAPEGGLLKPGEPPEPLTPYAARRVLRFLGTLAREQDPESSLALALRGYLASRMDPARLDDNEFLKKDAEGRPRLTALGRRVLLDILSAEDGELTAEEEAAAGRRPALAQGGEPGGATLDLAGVGADPAAFDGALHRLGAFDWGALAAPETGSADAVPPALEGFSVDRERGTVRVLVAAGRPAARDRFHARAEEAPAIYEEAGLSAELFDGYGARVVRMVDNLLTVDVPVEAASALGLRLSESGVESRPARLFRAAADAFAGPAAALLGVGLLPVPGGPKLDSSMPGLGIPQMAARGLTGRGALVGIVDSGLDLEHPDLQGRVQEYMDFTGEGQEDVVGHGTHVSGILAGSGAASQGRFAGAAPEAMLKVAKVFGRRGEADEGMILAAMKWMAGGEGAGARADVVNLSLSGPGAPNVDPMSAMANRLAARDGILVVASAGNRGTLGAGSVRAPGNARYALTVSGVTRAGEFPFFPSQGPVRAEDGSDLYNKPDLSAFAGDVDLAKMQRLLLERARRAAEAAGEGGSTDSLPNAASSEQCIYHPGGVIAPRSSLDRDAACALEGDARYRYMSGTSMATPMVAGMGAGIIGRLRELGYDHDLFQVRALLMETASDLGRETEVQGAGLASGERAAEAVLSRVGMGLPVGNVAFALAMRLTSADRRALGAQTRYRMTPLGLLDVRDGRLVNTERGIEEALKAIRAPAVPVS